MQANELFTQPNTILLDGGMGTMLQAAGLKLGARPEELNITDPQLIESIHSRYAAAGSRIINANTFGASAHKLAGSEYTLEEILAAGIANCKRACAPYGALAALDVGPLGELLEPNGTLAFEDAVAEYGRIVRAGAAAGADLVFFETFTDLYELKAALLAAKENCDLPILASMSFEAGGRTFTGCTVESFAVDLAKAHVVAIRRILENKQKEKVEVFNIGTGRGLSVLELINAFEKATGVKLNYQIVGRRAGDIEKVWANPELANNELGWKAETSIEDTLLSAWKWQLKLRERGIQ